MVSESMQTAIVLGGVTALLLLAVVTFYPNDFTPPQTQDGINKFNSVEEIKDFLKENTQASYWNGGLMMETTNMAVSKSVSDTAGSAPESQTSSSADDFSTTNIQVEGVDEADIVKNDDKYIYTLSGNTLSIVDAYPADNAKLISNITIDGNPQELYITDNTLVVLGNRYMDHIAPASPEIDIGLAKEMMPQMRSSTYAFAETYDITDKKNPKNIKTVSVDGNYFDSRMIDGIVYIIATQYTYYHDDIMVPKIATTAEGTTTNKTLEVYYFNMPDTSYSFTTIVSLDTKDSTKDTDGKIYLLGATSNLYVSKNNIYAVYQKRLPQRYFYERMVDDVVLPLVSTTIKNKITTIMDSNKSEWEKEQETGDILEEYTETLTDEQKKELETTAQTNMETFEREIAKETEKTIIHKIEIDNGNIDYKKTGEVPGHVLNQFSMDEYNNHFRIATTTGRITRMGAQTSANHIYVLDSELKQVGALEDLAPGETIYSARFMGKKAYMVTFVKIDPLFVIDLSDPKDPKVLGKLKIPGYSDYLHPYDENHIIGIGKETEVAESKNFVWQQGVKLALFDVTDVEKPKELSVYTIGDRGTDSYALHNHKAFLFSKDKNLLVIPILLAELDETKYADELPEWAYGEFVWQGAFVFNIDTNNGIELKGKITHADEDDDTLLKSGWYYYGSKYSVKRSLYMDDTLYTISNGMIKANDLDNLDEINAIELPVSETYPKYLVY